MIVAGSMIGSGIFIVSADMSRGLGSTGWLLAAWVITGLLTISAALSYGELAAMMPSAGGQYVYLREAWSPLWGFLYGWTLFLVIQTGTVAAVAVAFARYLGVLWPRISEGSYLIPPISVSSHYAVSLSTAQLVAILLIGLLSWSNARGIEYGKIVPRYDTLLELVRILDHDLLMVPRALVPVVQSLIRDHLKDQSGEGQERSLYADDSSEDTTEKPHDEV